MKPFRIVLVIIHFTVLLLLLGALLNDFVAPSVFPFLNILSLAFPVLLLIHLALILLWIVLRKKRVVFFLMVTFILMNPVRRWINFSDKTEVQPNLKIVSMNVKQGGMGKDQMDDYLQKTGADFIFLQEVGKNYVIPGYAEMVNEYYIVGLASKSKIIKYEKLAYHNVGNAFYADVDFNGKVLRLVNVYLNPFYFSKDMVRPEEDLRTNTMKAKEVVKRLIPTFKMHEKEISDIRTAVENSPYPVILAGDFNAVPNSYEYYKLGRGLTDAFMKVGRGSGTTFHDYKFPIRIDYIFTSKDITPISYKVDRSVKLSDHYPVIAEFKIDR